MNDLSCQIDFVAVGLREVVKLHLERLVDLSRVKFVDSLTEFDAFIDGFEINGNTTILVGGNIVNLSSMELGQTLRASYLNAHIVFIADDAKNFSISELKKNGYSQALLLPMDQFFFEELVLLSFDGGIRRKYKAVNMADITPGERLDFAVYSYMPLNKKYALLTANGSISEKKYEILKSKSETAVFVQMDQLEKFYEYSAQKMMRLTDNKSNNGSQTEHSQQLKQYIQSLFHNILDSSMDPSFESGRDLSEQSHKIVQKFIEGKTKINFKDQIDTIFDMNSDAYAHAQAVSSMAMLLSMAIDVGKPEDLGLAGLFHDIGITGFPVEPNPLTMHTLNKEDMARYANHPISSVHILKNKKIVLTPEVSEIIEKHHERVDGEGFPAGLAAHKIPLSAQLLAFSDWFEYLRRSEPGIAKPTPLEIIEKIQARAGLSMELILKIKSFFLDLKTF